MIDAEVMRLRRLRDTALRVRTLAFALESSDSRDDSVLSRSAVACWRMARLITGRLMAHPDLSYQRGPSAWRTLIDGIWSRMRSSVARHRRRTLEVLADELHGLARATDDARALTWSSELSDEFGRSQIQLRRLIFELGGGSHEDTGPFTADAPGSAIPEGGSGVAGNWPYLAF
jgi:hypothetical protein